MPGANGPSRTKNLLSKVYYDPRGKGTVPSGPNCVCRGESKANFNPELFVSGPQPVARALLGTVLEPSFISYSPV